MAMGPLLQVLSLLATSMPPFGTRLYASHLPEVNLTVVMEEGDRSDTGFVRRGSEGDRNDTGFVRWTQPKHFSAIFTYLPNAIKLDHDGAEANVTVRWRSSGDNLCEPECYDHDQYCQSKSCQKTKCQSKSVSCLSGTGDFRIALLDTTTGQQGHGNVSNDDWCPAGVKCQTRDPFSDPMQCPYHRVARRKT
eukprot:SAG31_NODE_2200_length_6208_cov_2.781306_8_plen_191_part_01